MRLTLLIGIIISMSSCTQDSRKTKMTPKIEAVANDTLIFTTLFEPAFEEVSLIKLFKIDTVIRLQILIKNNRRIDESQDTFYYKTISVSENEFTKIDTCLLRKTKIKYSPKQSIGFDGMSISFELIENGNTSRIGFWNPGKKDEIFQYEMTKTAISNFKSLFSDQVIGEYFDDLETYIDESKALTHSINIREIDELRIEKYNWVKGNPRE